MPFDPYPIENNSPVYWDLLKPNGEWFSLHTHAWSVKSASGKRFFAGSKRGEDLLIPFRRGRVYIPKTRESQTLDLNMWVFPLQPDGKRDPNKTDEQKAHENWRQIVAAFDQEGQFQLRKRWYSDNSTRETFRTAVETATAYVEFMDGTGPDSDDGKGFYVTLTLAMPDPYFYSLRSVTVLTDANKGSIVLSGEAPSDHLYIELDNSGDSDPKITFPDGNWVQFMSSQAGVNSNSKVTIDCRKGLAIFSDLDDYLAGIPTTDTYCNGLIVRSASSPYWPSINPAWGNLGSATIEGTADIRIAYDPAYR